MIRLITIAFIFVLNFSLAQHIVVPVQHQFARLSYNPGYAGVKQGLQSSLITRQSTQSQFPYSYSGVNVSAPVRYNSMGLGVVVEQSKIAVNKRTSIKGAFAYKIQVLKGVLSFGLDVGFDQYSVDTRGQTIQTLTDNTLFEKGTDILPVLGAGLFYANKKSFVGISIDRMLPVNIKFPTVPIQPRIRSKELTLVAGRGVELRDGIVVRPSVFIQAIANVPLVAYVSSVVDFKQKAWLGVGYRWDAELAVMAGVNFQKLVQGVTLPMKVGVSFSRPVDHGVPIGAPIEMMISYYYKKRPNPDKIKDKKRIVSPVIFY